MAFLSATKKKSIFDLVPSETDAESPMAQQVGRTVSGMLTGEGYDAEAQKARSALARSAKQLRANVAVENKGALGQGIAAKAQQETDQKIFEGLADTEMNIAAQRQAAKERGVTSALGIATAQEESNLAQQEQAEKTRQFDVTTAQTSELEKARLASQEKIAGMNIASTEKLALKSTAIDEAKLAETARQFNVSTEQAAKNFKDTMNFNYDELNVNQKNFLASLGLDQAKFEESKKQFVAQLEQEGRLTMAQLGVEEKKIAENARQFDTQDEFNRSELAANLSEAEKQRVWQATQNDKNAANAVKLAQMQVDLDTWKQNETTRLTELGYSLEDAQKKADRTSNELMQEKDRALQRLIANGQLTQAQAELAQKASQFTDQLAWEQEATRLGLKADEAERAWQTKERVSTQAFTAYNAVLDRNHDLEIESGRIKLEEKKLLQEASIAKDQLAWQKKAMELNLDNESMNRIWQSAEKAADRTFEAQQTQIRNAFEEKGWNYTAVMQSMESLPAQTQADMIRTMAVAGGITYPKTDSNGNIEYADDGTPVEVPGIRPPAVAEQIGKIGEVWKPGLKISQAQADSILTKAATFEKDGSLVTDNSIESSEVAKWGTTAGAFGINAAGRWVLTSSAREWVNDNVGKLYKASNGRLYEVVGIYNPKAMNSKGGILFKDAISGTKLTLTRGSSFPKE